MLQVSHGCPACGQVHDGRHFGLKHRAPRECPVVVVGSFPVVSLPSPPPPPMIKATVARRAPEFGLPSDTDLLMVDPLVTVQAARVRESDRSRGLGIPWLPPPDLGEVP